MSKVCSSCGHENREDAIFCGNCGSKLATQNMGNNFTGGNSSSSTSNVKSKVTYATKANGDNAGAVCCGVIIILFIIILIMSMG